MISQLVLDSKKVAKRKNGGYWLKIHCIKKSGISLPFSAFIKDTEKNKKIMQRMVLRPSGQQIVKILSTINEA
jgi:hypothetical protein